MNRYLHKMLLYPLLFWCNRLKVVGKIEQLKSLEMIGRKEIEDRQRIKLDKLLTHISENKTKYDYLDGDGIYPSVVLTNLPFLTKDALRDRGKILTSPKHKKFVTRETTGTTGKPVKIILDREAVSWQLAARYYFYSWHDVKIGDREARFWGGGERYKFSLKNFVLNRKQFSFLSNCENKILDEANALIHFRPDYFYGYSSLIYNCAVLWEEHCLPDLVLKVIICTAESLLPFQRKFIEKIFRCPVVMEYGCTEVDVIAFQCEKGRYHINTENVYFEILEDNTGIGQAIVTDLNNFCMPVVRYQVGDQCNLSDEYCSCGRATPLLESISGRTLDQLVKLPSGDLRHAVLFARVIEKINESGILILQFKVIQARIDYFEVYVELSPGVAFDRVKEMLHHGISTELGVNVEIQIIFGEIPRTKNKFTYFEIIDFS